MPHRPSSSDDTPSDSPKLEGDLFAPELLEPANQVEAADPSMLKVQKP